MIRGIGESIFLDLFSNFKCTRHPDFLIESGARIRVASGPLLVSRTGDAGCSESVLKVTEL